jgi:hypothetical protein
MNPKLTGICESIDPPVRIIEPHVTRTPGTTKCVRVLDRILEKHGEEHVTLLLRTVMESATIGWHSLSRSYGPLAT